MVFSKSSILTESNNKGKKRISSFLTLKAHFLQEQEDFNSHF